MKTYYHQEATTGPSVSCRDESPGRWTRSWLCGARPGCSPRTDQGSGRQLALNCQLMQGEKGVQGWQAGSLRVWVSGNGASSSPRATLRARITNPLLQKKTTEEPCYFPKATGHQLQNNPFSTQVKQTKHLVCFCRIT